MNVLARFPGATNDSYIYSQSALRRRMQDLFAQEKCFLIGIIPTFAERLLYLSV